MPTFRKIKQKKSSIYKFIFHRSLFAKNFWHDMKLKNPNKNGPEFVLKNEPTIEWVESDMPVSIQKLITVGLLYCSSNVAEKIDVFYDLL